MERILSLGNNLAETANFFLLDYGLKGSALLGLTALTALLLKRDSAATRHLVWLLGIAALVALPVISPLLPEWRVLPDWSRVKPNPPSARIDPPLLPQSAPVHQEIFEPDEPKGSIASTGIPSDSNLAVPQAQSDSEPTPVLPLDRITPWSWMIPLFWAVGCALLLLRLAAAQLFLRNLERQSAYLCSTSKSKEPQTDPLVTALNNASQQLATHRPVSFLLHPQKTIPIVWGIIHSRLLLPLDARNWEPSQLRSVLLHELAHIKRYDTLTQLLTQLACALHWFNPLVWIAAWRLGVERERACDDLVLANGVQPSAYAGHLLEIVTSQPANRGIPTGGLAMARKSSLESRLIAVLCKNINRRGVSFAIGTLALVITVGMAVPIAMLRAGETNPSPWKEEAGVSSAEPGEITQTVPNPVGQQPESSPKPSNGTKIKLTTEQLLKWGEPSNGLRMALAWAPNLDEPSVPKIKESYLAIQNISKGPILLVTNEEFPNSVKWTLLDMGRPIELHTEKLEESNHWLLAPQETAFLRTNKNSQKRRGLQATNPLLEFSLTVDLTIEAAPKGAWSGKLTSGQTRMENDLPLGKSPAFRTLFTTWTTAARRDGSIPAGEIRKLGETVKNQIQKNPNSKTSAQLKELLPRLEPKDDLPPAKAITLLDDLSAITTVPISMALENERSQWIHSGNPLTGNLANAPWGQHQPNGLRLAWVVEPLATSYPLGTTLKARLLIHNNGKKPVVFRTRLWHMVSHTARDSKRTEIPIENTTFTTRGKLYLFRLAPSDYIEVSTPGIGIGNDHMGDNWKNIQVGTWLKAKPGDEITVSSNPVPLNDWEETIAPGKAPQWWRDLIRSRLERHLPFPSDKKAREQILNQVTQELFGSNSTQEMIDSFAADQSPAALDSLTNRLLNDPGLLIPGKRALPWSGSLVSGNTTFKVLPIDPNTLKNIRVIQQPGLYNLDENTRLSVSGHPDDQRSKKKAHFDFFSKNSKTPLPLKTKDILLPEGQNTWSIAWVKGSTTLWVRQKGSTRSFDFANPAEIRETVFPDTDTPGKIPKDIDEALGTFPKEISKPPVEQQSNRNP